MSFILRVILTLMLVSCAQQQIILNQRELPFKGLDQVTVLEQTSAPVKLEQVKDARPGGAELGEGRTGAKYKKTPVYAKSGAEGFVRESLEDGLRRRGVLMVSADEKVELNVTINDLWVEEVFEKYQPERVRCRASLIVEGKKNASTYYGKFWTEVTSPGDMGDATEKISATMSSCMNAVMEKMVKEKKFKNFIKAKPLI